MAASAGDGGSSKADGLRLDDQLCFPLYAASNLLSRLYRPMLEELGLTYPQYLVMLVLWEQSPMTVGAIGGRLYLDSGTLTPLLKRMQANSLVTRQRDPRDERRVLVALTDAGKALRERARQVPEKLTRDPQLTACEAEALRDVARKLVAVLAEQVARAEKP